MKIRVRNLELLMWAAMVCGLLCVSPRAGAQAVNSVYTNGTNVITTTVTGDWAGTAQLTFVRKTGSTGTGDLAYWFQASGKVKVLNAYSGYGWSVAAGTIINWYYYMGGTKFYPGDSAVPVNYGSGAAPTTVAASCSFSGSGPTMTISLQVTGTIACPGNFNAGLIYIFAADYPDGTINNNLGTVKVPAGSSSSFSYSVPQGTIVSWTIEVDPASGYGFDFTHGYPPSVVPGGASSNWYGDEHSIDTSNSPTSSSLNSVGGGPAAPDGSPAPPTTPTSNPTPTPVVPVSGGGGASDATMATGFNAVDTTLTTVGNSVDKQISDAANAIIAQLQNGAITTGGGGGTSTGTDNAGIEARLDTIIADTENAPAGTVAHLVASTSSEVSVFAAPNVGTVTGLTSLLPAAPNIIGPSGSSTTVAAGSIPMPGGHSLAWNVDMSAFSGPLGTVRIILQGILSILFFILAVRTVRSAFAG